MRVRAEPRHLISSLHAHGKNIHFHSRIGGHPIARTQPPRERVRLHCPGQAPGEAEP